MKSTFGMIIAEKTDTHSAVCPLDFVGGLEWNVWNVESVLLMFILGMGIKFSFFEPGFYE